jgi:hypothetical protein
MAGAEPTKLERTLPRLPLEVKRPTESTLARDDQLKALGGFLREALDHRKRIESLEAEEREEEKRVSRRMDESGADALSEEIDRLRAKIRAGEADAGTEAALAAAKAKWIALGEQDRAPLRALQEKKDAMRREAKLKDPRGAEVAASVLVPGASAPDGVELSKIEADLGSGTLWLHWDKLPGSEQPAASVFLHLFHRPEDFEQRNLAKGTIQNRWPVIIEGPNNLRIWLREIKVDVSVSPEWSARGIKPRTIAESLLDFEALEGLDAAAAGK